MLALSQPWVLARVDMNPAQHYVVRIELMWGSNSRPSLVLWAWSSCKQNIRSFGTCHLIFIRMDNVLSMEKWISNHLRRGVQMECIVICLVNIWVKLNQIIHIRLFTRELMKLGDVLSSGELTSVAFACWWVLYLWRFIYRLARIRANHLPEIYLRALGRVLTFMLETKSRSAQILKWCGLGSAEDSKEMNINSLIAIAENRTSVVSWWDDRFKPSKVRLAVQCALSLLLVCMACWRCIQ